MRQITPDTVNEFVSQLVLFRKQERWIIMEFRRVAGNGKRRLTASERKAVTELSARARQWAREYHAFLESWAR
jgi:hypothetical protein